MILRLPLKNYILMINCKLHFPITIASIKEPIDNFKIIIVHCKILKYKNKKHL